MKKFILTIAMAMMAFVGMSAQDSFETAVMLQAGQNSAKASTIGYYTGAIFKYTATESCVLAVKGNNGERFSFYDEDQVEDYSASTIYGEDYSETCVIKLEAGKTKYIQANQSYNATDDQVSFNATFDKVCEGTTAEVPVAVEDGKTYWFDGAEGYMAFTATEDGVLVLGHSGYDKETTSTVDGVTTTLTENEKVFNLSVVAGKTYLIYTSNYSSLFCVTVKFTQPKQGETMEDPFIIQLGENTLPKAAQKYYYKYTNDETGFVTFTAGEGVMLAARSAGYSYNNLAERQNGTMRLALDMDQEIIVIAERNTEAEADGTLTVEFKAPEAGDTEGLAIAITPSESEKVSTAAGQEKYYIIKNEQGKRVYLMIDVVTEGLSSYTTSQVKAYLKGSYNSSIIGTDDDFRQAVEDNAEYIILVKNATSDPIEFRAWFKDIEAGDEYNSPIEAVLGENTVQTEGQKFYSYTPCKDCKLNIKIGNTESTTLFFPAYDGDEWMGIDGMTSNAGTYSLAGVAGKKIIFRMTGAAAGEKFVIEELNYGPGESRATAIEIDATYTLDDLAPYKVWLVYNVESDCTVDITPEGFEGITYNDNIYYAVNDGYEAYNSLRGYNEQYDYVMKSTSLDVKAGDKVYVRLDVSSLQEGATITIKPQTGTGINGVASTTQSQAIYDLSGKRLQKLQKGINIIGGHKFIVK